MHLGNVFAALLSWLSAKSQGGKWLLRIEDIDPQRSHREYAELIMDDLRWLGLEWDEGPYWQSERGDIYEHYLKVLADKGMTYPCYCTRADILATQAPHESDGRVVYKGTCRNLPPDSRRGPAAIRMRVPEEGEGIVTFTDGHYGPQTVDLTSQCGDFIVRRKDGAWAYQLAVVVDDARMGVTEVVRGADLLSSTARQLYLYRLLGLQAPGFAHCPLLLAPDGRRLSKRDGDQSLENLREKYTAQEIVGKLAYAYGLQPEPAPCTPESLISGFSWAKVPKQDVCLPEGLF
jgi:glutamyl-tRNA synthetase